MIPCRRDGDDPMPDLRERILRRLTHSLAPSSARLRSHELQPTLCTTRVQHGERICQTVAKSALVFGIQLQLSSLPEELTGLR